MIHLLPTGSIFFPMHNTTNPITYFAQTDHRNTGIPFGIKRRDRRHHFYCIGKTGTGKSTMLKTMIAQDIARGEGCCLFDPHGDLVESVVELVPPDRHDDLIYLDVPDTKKVWHFNPLADVPKEKRALAAAFIVDVFSKLWPDEWGPRLEHLLRNVIFTLLEVQGASLGDIPRLLTDSRFRGAIVPKLSNPEVRRFWQREYEGYSMKFRAVVVAPLQNKAGAFLTDPLTRRILTGSKNSFDLREVIDGQKILLVNLSKGRIGEDPASLLGSLLLSSLAFAGLQRTDTTEENRPDFYVYLDEFHTFSTLTLATMLSELRKYRINLILAHQYLSQLETEIRDAVLGNVGTLVSFRVGAADAPMIARELAPKFETVDLIGLPNFSVYLRLMIDGQVSRAFSGETVTKVSKWIHSKLLHFKRS